MAARTRRIRTMLRHPLAHREHLADRRRAERRYVRGRWRRRRAQDVLEHPFAAKHRRGAVGVRRDRQYAAVAEEARAHAVLAERDAAEPAAVDVRNAVMAREPLVHERVRRAQQVEHIAVLFDDAFKEELGFAAEGL